MKKTTKIILLLLLVLITFFLILYFSQRHQNTASVKPVSLKDLNGLEIPESPFNEQIIAHDYYTIQYSEENEQARWVAYSLTADNVLINLKRDGNFISDPKVTTGSALKSDYTRSGYDRGHLAPSADFNFSIEAMHQTYYMSNISPQSPALNRGIWKDLESEIRQLAIEHKKLYVVTGPIFHDNPKKIGKSGVSVPDRFFKTVIDIEGDSFHSAAFLIPQDYQDKNLNNYIISIDSLEKVSKLDFFSQLPDSIENYLERASNFLIK
ncbi:MAG: DNA/RNA non-specific endonuclease [Ignavibacteriales bacterium]|nr:DNA/RNA non-specific endonuclease [Ignavibacteriales bacterium]MCF8435280.1 DNA/RNA non-specific endonuclease [Ignavibacteriales bacterium]